jgi:hypothetical protein
LCCKGVKGVKVKVVVLLYVVVVVEKVIVVEVFCCMCVEKCTKGTECLSGEVGHLGQRAKVLVGKC